MLDAVFERLVVTYPPGTEFYRARISTSKLDLDKLGKPPADLTTPGRANPVGIPYLYVSDSEQTTLYETRIALHESITIGEFVAAEPINVVSLKGILEYGPFEIMDRGFDLVEFIQFLSTTEVNGPVKTEDIGPAKTEHAGPKILPSKRRSSGHRIGF